MKGIALAFGLVLAAGTLVWFFYFVPLGCAMNTTGCRDQFTVWSHVGLVHFWIPFVVAGCAIAYGAKRP